MKKMFKQSRWNIKDVLEIHKGKKFSDLSKKLEDYVTKFESYRSELNPEISIDKINEIIKLIENIRKISSKISAYATLWISMDTKNQEARAFEHKMSNYLSELGNRTIFFSLWFKTLDDNNMNRIIRESKEYSYFFERMKLTKHYSLTEPEEKIINLKDITGSEALSNLYDLITNGFTYDLKIKNKIKKLTQDEVRSYFRSTDPKMRECAYKLLLTKYKENKDVLGEIYKNIATDWSNECLKLRSYKTVISPRNVGNDITDKAVQIMLKSCKDNIHVFHKYFKLKAKLMKVNKLSRYHLYAPIRGEDKQYQYSQAVNLVLDCYNKFSSKMAELGLKIFNEEHVDSVITNGKISGAYCLDIDNETTPYILLNYTGKDRDITTMAHELGHGIHDLLTHYVPLLLSHPPLIFAETASVFGEMIVTTKILNDAKDKNEKVFLITTKIDELYQTIIRQSYFVMFELEAHKAINEGATIDELSKLYIMNLKSQFDNTVDIAEDFQHEWLQIPHIYHTPFYCYAYAFGNLITLALYQMYLEQGEEFVSKYIKFLSYGGSEKPMRIAAELGIDLESEEFWNKGFRFIDKMIDELEQLVK